MHEHLRTYVHLLPPLHINTPMNLKAINIRTKASYPAEEVAGLKWTSHLISEFCFISEPSLQGSLFKKSVPTVCTQ